MKSLIAAIAAALLLSSCGTSQMATSGDPGAVLAGASIGGNVGGALGSLIGGSANGWRGSYNGSAIGTIVGTIAGAAIGNAMTTPKQPREEGSYTVERNDVYTQPAQVEPVSSAHSGLRIRNLRFIDDNRNHVIESGEQSKVIFEIMNEGNETAYNVIPVVSEQSGMKHIYVSSSVLVEEITPHNGVKYTANINAGERIKTGEVVIRVSVADEYGREYDCLEFTLPTQR